MAYREFVCALSGHLGDLALEAFAAERPSAIGRGAQGLDERRAEFGAKRLAIGLALARVFAGGVAGV